MVRDKYLKEVKSQVMTFKELFDFWIKHQSKRVKWGESKTSNPQKASCNTGTYKYILWQTTNEQGSRLIGYRG
jgi:hypothetical protein